MAREGRHTRDPGRVFPSQMAQGGTDLADGGIGGRRTATGGLFGTRGGGFRQKEVPTVTPPPVYLPKLGGRLVVGTPRQKSRCSRRFAD